MPDHSKPANPNWAGLSIILWLLITIIAATKLAAAPYKHSVFPVYVAGVSDWLAGNHVYVEREGIDLYRYPPPSLPIFSLFYPWHISVGVILWTIVGSLGLYLSAEQLRIKILPGGLHWNNKQLGLYRFMVLLLAGRSLWNAQANTHVGALLIGGLAIGPTRVWLGAILTAMSLFLKPTIISIPMLALVQRPRQIAALVAAAMGIGLILSGPWSAANNALWKEWVEHGLASAGERRAAFRDAWSAALAIVASLSGKIPNLETPYPAGWLGLSGVLALTALATTLLFGQKLKRQSVITLAAFLGTAWFLLVGPAIEPPTYLLIGPWIGWALINRKMGYPQLPLIATIMILISFGFSGTPTTALLAWTPALLPLSVALLIPWYLKAIHKINHQTQA